MTKSNANLEDRDARRRRRPTALVVDDSVDAQEVLRENLEEAGFDVQVAENGREALAALFDQATPTLLVVDLLMPVMSGEELLEVVHSYRRLAQIPVLVVSGAEVPAPARLPRVRYLRKPIHKAELLEHVALLVGGATS